MFNSVCGEQQPHPARHEAGMEKIRAPNIRGPPRTRDPQENHRRDNRSLHPEKGRGEPEGVTSDSHSVDAPGCRGGKPAGSTGSRPHQGRPGQTGPWARRPKGPPPPNRGPARPVGPGPAKRPPRVGRRSPEHPAPARETTNAPAASSTGRISICDKKNNVILNLSRILQLYMPMFVMLPW